MFRRRSAPKGGTPGDDIFRGLRTQALTVEPASIGVSPTDELSRVFGVLMDMAYSSGTATLVALADGTASLYTSACGGVIGGGTHEQVARAARQLLATAEVHLANFAPAEFDQPPAVGHVLITVRTYSGNLSADVLEDDLGHGRHPAAEVFHAAHRVISALRTAESSSARGSGQELPGGATPLMAAAHAGRSDVVEDLIGQGLPIDVKDQDGYTALMYAANSGHEDVARVLLAHGANPNATDRQMSTPLMFAAQHDHLGVVRQLLAAGADPNRRGTHGLTALGFAQQNGHESTAAVLVAAGGT